MLRILTLYISHRWAMEMTFYLQWPPSVSDLCRQRNSSRWAQWLKALVGRARESRATAEVEIMSSTRMLSANSGAGPK